MATQLRYLNGSDRIGSPLMIRVKSATLTGTISFHNLKVEVRTALQTQTGDQVASDLDTVLCTMSRPVGSGEQVDIDISSALRTVADRYQYQPTQLQMPHLTGRTGTAVVTVYDEYMKDGITYTQQGVATLTALPDTAHPTLHNCMFMGAYNDLERLLAPRDTEGQAWLGMSGTVRTAASYTRKPSTLSDPELVPLGAQRAVPTSPDGSTLQTASIVGLQHAAEWGKPCYVFNPPQQQMYYTMRFINGYGLMETVSLRRGRKQKFSMQSAQHLRALQEPFGTPGQSYMVKSQPRHEWTLSTGPVSEPWLHWYATELLMTPQAWMALHEVQGRTLAEGEQVLWLPVHIAGDDSVELMNSNETETLPELQLTVKFDIDGALFN